MRLNHFKNLARGAGLLMLLGLLAVNRPAVAQNGSKGLETLHKQIDTKAEAINQKVIAWRRDIHEHPELSNREFRTSKKVAEHLKSLGIEVRTGVAHTGVVGVLKGGRPGRVVAIRADMDALPVKEQTGLPYASEVTSTYNGKKVGVMHACGHDNHVAILMGVAEVLADMRDELPGTVKFIFQPAEEGAPKGEEGGADLMIKEGALENPRPDVIFGLHIGQSDQVGDLSYTERGAMASADVMNIKVIGKQTHGAYPWGGIDPIVVSAQIINGLQTIPSRQMNATVAPSIVTVGMIDGGVRNNIIPDEVTMKGTIRALDPDMRKELHMRIQRTAEKIAESAGAKAEVEIDWGPPVTYNDPQLTENMVPTLQRVAGKEHVIHANPVMGAEDFAFYQQKVPGFYFWLGGRPADVAAKDAIPNHSPRFYVDEAALKLGVRSLSNLAVDYLAENQ